ncbi:MAG: CNNM domain-containing protein, partial [Bacteroidota bacterium]
MDTEPPNPGLFSFFPLLYFSLIDVSLLSGFFLLIVLIVCSALVSGSEVAFFSLSPNDEKDLEEEESKVSKRILKLVNNPQKLLATILISNNFINILIIIISAILVQRILPTSTLENWQSGLQELLPFWSHWDWVTIIEFLTTVVGVAFILVLFGEIAPKIYANLNNVRLARIMSRPLTILSTMFNPISSMLVGMSSGLEKRLEEKATAGTSKEDIDSAIDLAVSQEDSTEEEVDMLKGIVKFNEVMVRQIMKSRVDVMAVDEEIEFDELMRIIKSSSFSRIPVMKEDLDNITGILYV